MQSFLAPLNILQMVDQQWNAEIRILQMKNGFRNYRNNYIMKHTI